jgi:rSAM/selenodomain-associated transferase 1
MASMGSVVTPLASMKHRRSVVVVFARAPEPGKVKTRLAASIGAERACALYQWLGARVVSSLVVDEARTYDVRVCVTPAEGIEAVRAWIPGADTYVAQREGDLGVRLDGALRDALAEGYDKVLLVGTDCIAVDHARVCEALAVLDRTPAVLGPSCDGGYYLLGLCTWQPVFDDIAWSTDTVAAETRRRLTTPHTELAVERDIDTVDDLAVLRGLVNV